MKTPVPWLEMWLLCFALFGAAKLWVLARTQPLTPGGKFAFLSLWIGMDADAFAARRANVRCPAATEWLLALGKTGMGVLLVWGVTRRFVETPLLAGWVGMAGLIFCLHFGTFHLLGLVWRRIGVPVTLLMDRPHRATTLAEFWGVRWNRAFHRLTHELIFTPACRRFGPRGALWLGFFVSGLVHELIISVPARGGWGGPTLYFLLQALGLTLQRSRPLRRRGFAAGARGWLWTMLFTAGPAFILFHPPFVERVMLPFLTEIRAL